VYQETMTAAVPQAAFLPGSGRLAFHRTFFLAVLASLAIASQARAVTVPVGVQTNVPVSTVTAWGWTTVYHDTYATKGVPISTLFAGVPPGSYVMYAAKPTGSNTFTLLAAALESDVRAYTPPNTPHVANGAGWYYNNASMGFAGLGQAIYQGTADLNDTGIAWGTPLNQTGGALRLSWHTNSDLGYGLPTVLNSGWRAGNDVELNFSTTYERYILVAPASVPEPGTLTLLAAAGLGLAGWTWSRRKRAGLRRAG
jgi:hypothetical protein